MDNTNKLVAIIDIFSGVTAILTFCWGVYTNKKEEIRLLKAFLEYIRNRQAFVVVFVIIFCNLISFYVAIAIFNDTSYEERGSLNNTEIELTNIKWEEKKKSAVETEINEWHEACFTEDNHYLICSIIPENGNIVVAFLTGVNPEYQSEYYLWYVRLFDENKKMVFEKRLFANGKVEEVDLGLLKEGRYYMDILALNSNFASSGIKYKIQYSY